MTTLLIATRNAHKAGEIETILGAPFRCLSLKAYPDAPPVVEDADTFAGNAAKKAKELSAWLLTNFEVGRVTPCAPSTTHERAAGRGLPALPCVLADDSGLEVDALNGAPGVHSARFAAADTHSGNSPDADNNARLLRLLKDVPMEKRTARFRCVIAFVTVDNAKPQLFDGACEGRIQFAPRGANGFGYDPLFVPEGFQQTFAELGEDTKNQLSHRSQALAKFKAWLAVQTPAGSSPVRNR